MSGNKYIAFYAAYNASVKAGNPNSKEEVVKQFTKDRTDSLKDLSAAELHDLVTRLNTHSGFVAKRNFYEGKEQKMRAAFFPMAYEMGWGDEALPDRSKRTKVVAQLLDEWCLKQKYKKGFNQLSAGELSRLLTIFKTKVYGGFLKR